METSIYLFHDYKVYLQARIKKAEIKHGFISRMAEAACCQRSYLSQVLNGPVQLTSDHALGLCLFFHFNDTETDYFLLLVGLARAGSLALRERLQNKLERMRKEHTTLSERLDANPVTIAVPDAFYYSSWHWMAIHIISNIPEFRTIESIAQRLHLPESLVQKTLEQLMQMGYVEKKKGRWAYLGGNLHLSHDSPSVVLHHNNWRQRSILDSAIINEESIHYTSVFTLSQRDLLFLKERLLVWIDESRKIIGPSPSEEMACFCMDLFKV